MDLEVTDAAILRSLQEDARASLRTIAKKVGVSVPTAGARLKNLEQAGIIRGYRALLDPHRLDATSVALVVKTKPQRPWRGKRGPWLGSPGAHGTTGVDPRRRQRGPPGGGRCHPRGRVRPSRGGRRA